MTDEQRQNAEAALAAWVAPLLANASMFTRGSYQAFFEAHKEELIDVIGNAVLAVPNG